nr:fatty acid synthase-like [Helicoverpa armigera]
MRIVTKHEPFDRTFTALNSFSFTGPNAHLLLKGHFKPKDTTRYHSRIPYLVTLSGRQETAVQKVMDSIKSNELDPEEIALYHAIHKRGIQKHMARGYGIYETVNQKTRTHCEKVEYFDDARRPLWFVYSGMGSQWPGMGAELMRIPIFAAAIERCDKILKPKGLDIVDIITNPDDTILENILHCFVGIAAIQIGLTDILRAVGLVPDHIIGHSVGELGCAYADGCCTAAEVIQMSYSRGLISTEMTFIKGSMAAVGLGYKQISKICPSEIDIACHNGPDSCTISGPADAVHKFVSQLTEQGIFAKEVKCSNIAYHSRYVAKAGPKLLQYTKQVYKEPKLRSERWLSTSVERDKWHEAAAKYSSAKYHTNNLLRPVLFEETSRLIPNNAVLVEVAPHGLLQAILKRSLPRACRHVPLTRRAHPQPARLLLDALGTLYMAGYDLDVSALYPRIDFPVATQTRQLSHTVEWVHTEEWNVLLYEAIDQTYTAIYQPKLTVNEDDFKFLEGSIIEGKKVFPLAGALVFVWDTLTMITEMPLRETSIEFHNLTVHKQPLLNDTRMLRLVVMLQRGSGQFEVTHEGNPVVEGKIVAVKTNYRAPSIDIVDEMTLNSTDVYKLLYYERGFEYSCGGLSIEKISFKDKPIHRQPIVMQTLNFVPFIQDASENILDTIQQLYPDVFLVTVGENMLSEHVSSSYVQVSAVGKEASRLSLLRKKSKPLSAVAVTVARPEDLQCLVVARANLQPHQKLVAFTSYPPPGDLKQLVKQWRSHQDRNQVFLAMVNDKYKVDLKQLPSFELPFNIFYEVHYAELNNYDAQRLLARLPVNKDEQKGFGMSFSGITERGEHVMGITPTSGSVSAKIRSPVQYLWPVPSHWSLEDAATVPLAYTIAFYCLGIKSRLLAGTCVLVHGGAGAVGQATIAVALAAGCRVFTTVSDHHKKTFLTKLFPDLPAEHIGSSRNDSFKTMVKYHTKGKGCDIVLSCVKGFLKSASLSCCGFAGLAFDLTQIQNQENYQFGLYNLAFARSYTTITIPSIFDDRNIEEFKKIKLMISEGIRLGYVRPLSRVTYAPHDAARAFRLLAASRHRGRVLLRMHEQLPPAQPRLSFSNNSCHLIFCDKDGFGFVLADRLVERGAQKLFLRVPNISSYSLYKKEVWVNLGIEVKISSNALDSIENVRNIFNEANAMGHIEGVHIVATDSDDTLYADEIIYDIDVVSREVSPELRLFTVVSEDDTVGRNICSMRRQSNFNSLFVQLKLEKFADLGLKEDKQLSWRIAADAVGAAMLSGDAVVVVNAFHQPLDLLQQVAQVPGVVITSAVDDTATLAEIGIDQSNEHDLCTLLEEKFNIVVQKDKVPSMTVGQ